MPSVSRDPNEVISEIIERATHIVGNEPPDKHTVLEHLALACGHIMGAMFKLLMAFSEQEDEDD